VLKKEFKYIPNADAAKEKPDENGISDAMVNTLLSYAIYLEAYWISSSNLHSKPM